MKSIYILFLSSLLLTLAILLFKEYGINITILTSDIASAKTEALPGMDTQVAESDLNSSLSVSDYIKYSMIAACMMLVSILHFLWLEASGKEEKKSKEIMQ